MEFDGLNLMRFIQDVFGDFGFEGDVLIVDVVFDKVFLFYVEYDIGFIDGLVGCLWLFFCWRCVGWIVCRSFIFCLGDEGVYVFLFESVFVGEDFVLVF